MREAIDIDAAPAGAFALSDELTPGDGHWHSHRRHQLLYAASGVMRLEIEGGAWLLPSARAAWLRSGVRHSVELNRPASLRTVYFEPSLLDSTVDALGDCCVFAVTPLCRELILYAMRWGPDRPPDDTRANRFFAVLADCCADWVSATRPFQLPRARTAALQQAMNFARERLVEASAERAARHAGLSVRSLSRRFRDETGTTWRAWLRKARILAAMEQLADPGVNVTEVAFAVGFDSPAAFTHAFRALTGEPPSVFRRRLVHPSRP